MHRAKRIRTPRLYEIRGEFSGTAGSVKAVREDWSLRSAPHRLRIKKQGVYLIHAEGTRYYKIGVAIDVYARLRELQCATPHRLILKHYFRPSSGNARRIESTIHAEARVEKRESPAGNEFFQFLGDDEAITFIKRWDTSSIGM